MNKARNWVLAVASVSLLAGVAASATMASAEETAEPATVEESTVEVVETTEVIGTYGLLNTTAGVDECPDGVGEAWHFVAPPKSQTDFLAITLFLDGDSVVIEDWLEFPLAGDAYVTVPGGYDIDDLEGGEFVVAGPIDDKGVRLSHTCEGPEDPPTPSLVVSKTAVHTRSADYDWSVTKDIVDYVLNDDGTVDVDYSIVATKSDLGNQQASVSGVIRVENTGTVDVVVTGVVDDLLGVTGENCTFGSTTFPFDLDAPTDGVVAVEIPYTCTLVPYETQGEGTNRATINFSYDGGSGSTLTQQAFTYSAGTITDDSTKVVDDAGTPGNTADDVTLGTPSMTTTYSFTKSAVVPGGSNCEPGYRNTATVTDDLDENGNNSDDALLPLCTNRDGWTIGFWGNQNGWAILGSNNFLANALTNYPNVRNWDPNGTNQAPKAPSQWTSQRDARDYFLAANCSATCKTMLGAQFLGTAFNVQRTPALGTTNLLIPPSLQSLVGGASCASVTSVLAAADTYFLTVNPSNLSTTTALKSLFDRINNNLAVICPN
jgi:hypothetical protein